MTTEALRISQRLTEGTDHAAAALLVAMSSDEGVEVLEEDRHLMDWLVREGLVADGRVTALGQRVVVVLRAMDGMEG